jgi:TonB-dependent starch-binding outer membrane protein SusC
MALNANCNRLPHALILGRRSNWFINQTLRIVKLTAIFLTVCSFTVAARTVSQTITFSAKNAELKKVFDVIKQQTGYYVLYEKGLLKNAKPVSLNVSEMPLIVFMNELMKEQPLVYSLRNTTITIEKKTENVKGIPQSTLKPTVIIPPVSGIIRSSDGELIAGANIVIKGTKRGTSTGANGYFSIDAEEGAILIVSSIGFTSQTIEIKNVALGNIIMERSDSKLDEVQIIAYGTTSQRLNTGNVTSVKAKDIEKQPVSNPLLALQGRVPGLFITQATGYSGTGVTVRIQGQNSMNSGNDPLYVIDGVPFSSQLLPSLSMVLGNSGQGNDPNGYGPIYGNPLNFINPNDIESIDVLKDADATAIYGSRAANGAILITTKKGKAGKLKLDINLQKGWGNVASKIKLLNNTQYLDMRQEALKNDGLTANPDRDYDLFNRFGWNNSRNTDWQKVLIGNTASFDNFQSSVSGGSENMQVNIGATYRKEKSVLPTDFANQSGSLHFSATATSFDKKAKLLFTGSYLTGKNELPNLDLTYFALSLPPTAPELYNTDGSINWALNDNGSSTWGANFNPVAILNNRYQNKTNNLTANISLSYQIFKGLEFKGSLGYNKIQTAEINNFPVLALPPELKPYIKGYSEFLNSSRNSWITEPQLSYNTILGDIKLNILLGGTIQNSNSKGLRLSGLDYASDEGLGDLSNASIVNFGYSSNTEYRYNALFSRITFNVKDEYVLNFTARRDGSSRFGSANLYHTFGSLAAAWIFSQKEFIKNIPFISFGKIRASYGTTGSDQIKDYKFLNLYAPTYRLPYQGVAGTEPESFSNPYLQWEETKKLQFGLDLGFFKDRILFNANYYRNKSGNQLVEYNLPIMTGFLSVISNFPATVQNSGLEMSLSGTNFKTRNFSWSTNFNITIAKNELKEFPGLDNSSYKNFLVVGQSLSVVKLFKFAGVNPETGVYQFMDRDGKITSDPNQVTDRYILQNGDPKFYGGLQNSLTFRSFNLDFLFQFIKKSGIGFRFGSIPGYAESTVGNQPTSVLNRWQKPGDVSSIQQYNSDFTKVAYFGNALNSDAGFSDASYIRLKNISLSWNFPSGLINNTVISSAQIFAQAQNLLTITKYKGLDPETLSVTTLPPLKMITVGFKLSF